LRFNGITDLSDVYYAIVEENGKLTVIPRSSAQPATLSQLNISSDESGLSHILVSDGRVDSHGLKTVGINRRELDIYLEGKSCTLDDVFLLLCDDCGKYTLVLKDKKQ
jgi:uncharacterized membrane protein YcaP (DUF421 family)